MKRSAVHSIALGTVLATMLWLDLEVSDAIFQSRLLPWVLPLIHLQYIGFRVAARLFPCQMEGFDTGCEMYKTVPALLAANSLAYSIVSFPIVHFWRRRK
jgi:hypothetical protein